MSQFLHDDHNDDAKAIAIPRVFSENSQANKLNLEFPPPLTSSRLFYGLSHQTRQEGHHKEKNSSGHISMYLHES